LAASFQEGTEASSQTASIKTSKKTK